ncbi:MAG: hypothetical protein PHY62_04975 [Gallionella sp.]|nr:hypothetical protein [Gallionella sp.]
MLLIAFVGGALTFTIIVMVAAAYLAKDKGKSPLKWSLLSLLGLFVLTAWDYYPIQWAHQYYCEKESGFWIYKTLDQWKAENPGVMEGLTSTRVSPSTHQDSESGRTVTYFLNQRFNWVVKRTGELSFNQWRWEQVVLDSKTNEVLARYVDFSTGNGAIGGVPEVRFWLHRDHCSGGETNDSKLAHFFISAKNINEKGVVK